MRKILLAILAIAATVFGADTTGTWNSAAGTRMDSLAAWSWSPAQPSGFTSDVILIYDSTTGTNTASTAGANLSVKSVTITNKYKGAWSISGRTLTCAEGFSDDGPTGAKNYGNDITCNGASATFHVGSGVGTVTATSCVLTMNGTTGMTIDNDNAITIKQLILGAAAKVTNSGAATTTISGAVTSLTLGANCTFTVNRSLTITLSASVDMFSIGAGVTFNGSGTAISCQGLGTVTIGLPAMTYTGSSTWYFQESVAAADVVTLNITGALSFGGAIVIRRRYATNTTTFTTNGNAITAGALYAGSNNATGTMIWNCGASVITCASFETTTYNVGASTINASTSQWICKGSFALGSNTTWVPTSERIVFANTAKATITSAGETLYDVIDSATTGQIDTLADSLTAHDFIIKSGKMKGISNGLNLSGNFTWANTCSDSIFARMSAHNWTFTGSDPTLTLQGTGVRLLDSAKWVPQNNLTIVMDSNNTIHRLSPTRKAASQRYTMQASRKLSLYYNLDYTWSGQGGNLDSMKSSTPGNYARIGLAAAKVDSQLYLKDMAFQGYAEYCTTGCTNGGNDSNVVWDTLKITAISPASISTLGGPCTLTTIHGRTSGGSVTVDGGSATLTSQTPTQWIFTAPAHAAGVVDVVTQSGLGFDPGDDTISLTYLPSCTTSALIRAPTQTAIKGVTITPMVHAWTGGTPDSIKVRTALPAALSAHPATGTITGIPAAVQAMTGYMVVAYGCNDSSIVWDSLRVNEYPLFSTLKHPAGWIGYSDTIIGSGFKAAGFVATLGGTAVTIGYQTDDSLIWTVPTKARGTYSFIGMNTDSLYDTVNFRVLVPAIGTTVP